MSGTWVLMPLRELGRGKERLGDVLDAAQRRALIEAMAEDVITALLEAGIVAGQLLVVSEDPEVAALARRRGVGCFRPAPATVDPLNAQLAEAVAHAAGGGADSALILHADLPRAHGAALRAVLAAHAAREGTPRTTLVTDRAGTGTNCLLCTPPAALALAFGADSRARHRAAAGTAGAHYAEFTEPALAFDIDFAEDLRALVRLGQSPDNAVGPRTRAWLAGLATDLS